MSDKKADDKYLLELISNGDEVAFKALFEKYRDKLHFYLFGITKSSQVAEEIVMDVFLKIWFARTKATEINHFDNFLYKIAHNKAIDFLRTVHRDQTLFNLVWDEMQLVSDQNADSRLKENEKQQALQTAVSKLPPKRRLVYELSRKNGLTHDQIALYLNLSKNTVNNHLVESLRFIKIHLSTYLEPCFLICVLLFKNIF
jgi:RNA polymerase sigma-70 factor (ECF subfamily)